MKVVRRLRGSLVLSTMITLHPGVHDPIIRRVDELPEGGSLAALLVDLMMSGASNVTAKKAEKENEPDIRKLGIEI